MASQNKLLYFAYGSNLMAERIHVNNPSAVLVGPAKLQDYRLDFSHWSKRWHGAAATVAPDCGETVWGAVWELDQSDVASLDRQEGVATFVYFPIEVCVETPSGQFLKCRSYQLCDTPPKIPAGGEVPASRQPSEVYWRVILVGAKESGLPEDYIEELKKIKHNGYVGPVDVPLDVDHLLRSV